MNQEQMIKYVVEDPIGYHLVWYEPLFGINSEGNEVTGNSRCTTSIIDGINAVNLKVKERKLSYSLSELQKLESFIIIHNATIEREGGMN